ncbi:MAG: prepilin-type N-terminal cleavage/methylation domain-containing protein [Planctomycetes bacterium]|nr:prepilin-type N-terminal cleavage/methylation domain-containing protein [Planctomycetota bacterium]
MNAGLRRTASDIRHRTSDLEHPTSDLGHRTSGFGQGFTLIEVMIALAVLVIGLASLLPLFAVGTASHRRGMDQTQVSLIAPHIIGRIQERLYEPRPKDLKDQVYAEFGRAYTYDVAFTPLDRDGSNAAFLVRVTVRWADRSEGYREEFATVLLRRGTPPAPAR